MDPAIGVLLAIVICLIPVGAKIVTRMQKKFDEAQKHCNKISDRVIVVETKLDIYLDHSGFDIRKVNKAITDNMEELKKNDKPTVGCIHVKELYKEV